MAHDLAEATQIERPPRGRKKPRCRFASAGRAPGDHSARSQAGEPRLGTIGDDGTNDLVVSDVLRTNELQVWFLSEHLVNVPLVIAQEPGARRLGSLSVACKQGCQQKL